MFTSQLSSTTLGPSHLGGGSTLSTLTVSSGLPRELSKGSVHALYHSDEPLRGADALIMQITDFKPLE
jgi:hypothetical protein